jgi:putative Mn2+ efflux pump MntP
MASLTIGIVAFLATIIGFLVGRKAGELIGRRAVFVGGVILIGIGLRILITHIFGG